MKKSTISEGLRGNYQGQVEDAFRLVGEGLTGNAIRAEIEDRGFSRDRVWDSGHFLACPWVKVRPVWPESRGEGKSGTS